MHGLEWIVLSVLPHSEKPTHRHLAEVLWIGMHLPKKPKGHLAQYRRSIDTILNGMLPSFVGQRTTRIFVELTK